MATVEQSPILESKTSIPLHGTLPHLKYLSELEIKDGPEDEMLHALLGETRATRSLSIFIKHLRTFRPIRTPHIDMDTRLFDMGETRIPVLTCSIYRDFRYPERCHLTIHGQPQPWELGEKNYTYDLLVPIHFNFAYDSTRPSQAVFRYGEDGRAKPMEVYNQLAFPEYDEHNPQILVKAVNHAARDMFSLVNEIYTNQEEPVQNRMKTISGNILMAAMSGLTGASFVAATEAPSPYTDKYALVGGAFLGAAALFGKKAAETYRETS